RSLSSPIPGNLSNHIDAEEQHRDPHNAEAEPARQWHRLAEEQPTGEELQHGGEELDEADEAEREPSRPSSEEQQRDRGDRPGTEEQDRVPGPVHAETEPT